MTSDSLTHTTTSTPVANWWSRWWPWITATGTGAAVSIGALTGGHPGAARMTLVVLATGISASSAVPSILASRSDPASLEPVTWAIWCVLTGTAAVASTVTGDYPSATFAMVGTITCGAVAIVTLRRGRRVFTAGNAICILIAAVGLIAWLTVDQPAIAVLAACIGDLAALTPTIRHAWRQPAQEPTAAFALIAVGGLCTAVAAWGQWTITALAYPLYVAASTGAVAVLTLRAAVPGPDPAGTAAASEA